MRPRILHLIDTGGPGGAETVYHDLVTGLESRGWGSIAAVPVRDWLYDTLRASGVEPVVIETSGSFDVRYVRKLLRLARSGAVLIHAHLLGSSVYGAMAGVLARLPVVCTFHGAVDVSETDRLISVKFRIISNLSRARVVFVSESLRRRFIGAVPLDAARTHVIPNGIASGRFHPGRDTSLRRELGMREGEVLVGAIGNVRPSKAYDVLLRAAAILCSESAEYRFVIVGQSDGELYCELRALHSDLGLGDRVRFLGFRHDIPTIMRNLNVYVSSSRDEGFSLTTVEAMASGVPVVATRSGGPEEIVEHGVTGVLVPPGSPEALANAIGDLSMHGDRRHVLATAARDAAARRFTIDAMVSSYEDVYETCMIEKSRAALRPAPAVQL